MVTSSFLCAACLVILSSMLSGSGPVNAAAAPTVTTITPSWGNNDNSNLAITDLAGTGFVEGASVKLIKTGEADIDATAVTVESSTRVTCKLDLTGRAAGYWDVRVINPDLLYGTKAACFKVEYPPPAVTGCDPAAADTGATVHMTVTGSNFRSGDGYPQVKLRRTGYSDVGGTNVTFVSATELSCDLDLAGREVGAWNVIVLNDDIKIGTLLNGFTIGYPAPTFTTITPSSGREFDIINVTGLNGTNFRAGASVKLRKVGQADRVATGVTIVSAANITCAIDLAGASVGAWDIVVTNDDGKFCVGSGAFTVELDLKVTGITPDNGDFTGAVSITDLAGTEFVDGATVQLTKAGQAAIDGTSVAFVHSTKLTCGFNLTGACPGLWNVVVTNPDLETGTLVNGFKVMGTRPTLSSISPASAEHGQAALSAELDGTDFYLGAGVKLTRGVQEIQAESVSVLNLQAISAVFDLSDAEAGTWYAVVTNEDGQFTAESIPFEVEQATPTVTGITPSAGTNDRACDITDLAGTHFREPAVVWLQRGAETIDATSTVVVSENRMTCRFDLTGQTAGSWDVKVMNDDDKTGTLTGGFTIGWPAPTLSSISPTAGTNDGKLHVSAITGTGFHTGAQVRLKRAGQVDIPATGVTVGGMTRIACDLDLTGAAAGAWDLRVQNSDGQYGTKVSAFTVSIAPTPTWYVAEGTSDYGFETYVTVMNPNEQSVTARVTYMTKAGPKGRPDITLPARSQTVINPRNDVGATDFSTKVQCLEGRSICVDRRMTWTGAGAASSEGHSSIGVTAPARSWYLAEGSSRWGFETWLLIQNPGTSSTSCTVTYMIEGEQPVQKLKTVGPGARGSFSMLLDIGEKDASIKVESGAPVIAERAMYRNNRREGHDSIGATAPSRDFYLAEGTTDWGFTTYVLVQNPNSSANTINITYMSPSGPISQQPFTMQACSRKTIRVNDVVNKKDVSTRVTGSLPVIAERAMYWDNGSGEACHDSIGISAPHMTFYLPDGEAQNGYETWTLLQNPNSVEVTVELVYMTPTGQGNVTRTTKVPANSRASFSMAAATPSGRAAIQVRSMTGGKPIMVERAMYWNGRGAGTDTIGGFIN